MGFDSRLFWRGGWVYRSKWEQLENRSFLNLDDVYIGIHHIINYFFSLFLYRFEMVYNKIKKEKKTFGSLDKERSENNGICGDWSHFFPASTCSLQDPGASGRDKNKASSNISKELKWEPHKNYTFNKKRYTGKSTPTKKKCQQQSEISLFCPKYEWE